MPPKESTSTPASTVNERSVATSPPRAAVALAIRAPSMCTVIPRRWAVSHTAATSAGE